MAAWTVKKGNTSIQDVLIKDKDGTAITNMGDVTEIKFVVKKNEQSTTELISLTEGSGIEVDTPSTGYARITLSPTNTDLSPGDYYMGLQLTWSASLVYEVILKAGSPVVPTNIFTITQDVVN